MSTCKHKIIGQADWVGACPHCEIERLQVELGMNEVFYRLAIKERDYERARNKQLLDELAFYHGAREE